MKFLRPKPTVDPVWTEALRSGDDHAMEATLLQLAPQPCRSLEDVALLLADSEQVRTLRYWQRSRWGRGGASQALDEMRRVFAKGPQWRNADAVPSKLPPLYPE